MKLYVKIIQRVSCFNLMIFKKPGKGRIMIDYSSPKLRKFSTKTNRYLDGTDNATISVNIYKWLVSYEPLSFMGVLPYTNGGVTQVIVIKNRNAVEHFLRDWI